MTRKSANRDDKGSAWTGLDEHSAKSLLAMALRASARPLDQLIERLTAEDGPRWLAAVSQNPALAELGVTYDALIDGEADLKMLESIKDLSKSAVARQTEDSSKLEPTYLYFMSLAAALAHHGEIISSQGRQEILDAFEELADALPHRERSLIDKAMKRA